ncbi:MAG: hypothetical protein KAF41_01590 [Flavobacterium sp.]|nr:hypothetical protein [Flavobacterium sp.]
MLYFILETNEKIELTHRKITFTERNLWFESEFSSEFSFPFELQKADFLKISDFAHYNASGAKKVFKGKLYRDGELTDATLKIQNQKGDVISGIIFSGMEALPNFDKQLKDLPLGRFDVVNLKAHALDTITKDYPDVTHNFVMVHTDKYDPKSEEFNGFLKIYNNYSGGQFLNNLLQEDSNKDIIQNIMQPFPYLMHILNVAMNEAGYELAGDIININDLKKALVFRDGSYFNSLSKEAIPFRIRNEEWVSSAGFVNGYEHVHFQKSYVVEKKGDYIIFGQIFSLLRRGTLTFTSDLQISIGVTRSSGSAVLFNFNVNHANTTFFFNQIKVHDIDIPISLEVGDIIHFLKVEPRRDVDPSPTPDYPETCSLEIIPIRYRNPDGSPIISVLDLNEIDLTRVVPDMTVGDLVTIVRVAKNLDLNINGNIVTMNYIQPQLSRNSAKDLSDFDIEEPERIFHDDRTYELYFVDGKKDSNYQYDSIFVSADSVLTNVYRKEKTTTEIKFDFLPYPVINRNSVTTAFAFDDESSKLRLIFFNSVLPGDPPVCFDNTNMLVPSLYYNGYSSWIDFLIKSIGYQWDFVISVEKFKEIQIQSLIYAYSNYHIFSEIEKERINQLYWRGTAKSESL